MQGLVEEAGPSLLLLGGKARVLPAEILPGEPGFATPLSHARDMEIVRKGRVGAAKKAPSTAPCRGSAESPIPCSASGLGAWGPQQDLSRSIPVRGWR